MTSTSSSSHLQRIFFFFSTSFFLLTSSAAASDKLTGNFIIAQADYHALQHLKSALVDPGGIMTSWNGTAVEEACSGGWVGVRCIRGRVVAIQLPGKHLSGSISEKIGELTALRKISLHDNSIGGRIPSAIGSLLYLRGLYLFNNMLSGSIPSSIGDSGALVNLDLSNNLLTGSIPSSLANSTRLYRLNLSSNNLSGAMPYGITAITSLTFLVLQHNVISGLVPDDIDELKKLTVLSLKGNSFHGEIPATLGNMSSLSVLDLSENELTGEIPASLEHLTELKSFDVSDNNLSGRVPLALSQKFNASSFRGNIQLCGYTSSVPCPSLPSPNLPFPPPPPPPPSPPKQGRHPRLKTRDIILIASGAAIVLLLFLCCLLLFCLIRKKSTLRRKSNAAKQRSAAAGAEPESGEETGGKLVLFDGPLVFTADDLLCATAEIMGKSVYGTVYKATLEDGNEVAVKRLREKIVKNQKDFEAAAGILGRIRHPNLVALRAYYLGPKGEKLLVFDYMPKGSLSAFLHAHGPETVIDWRTRMNIVMGLARGLCHLHDELGMVHGHLTSSNVLLDENANAKICDYGLSNLIIASAAGAIVVPTAGAIGYRAPELSKVRKADTTSDVYSLGVIMLEVLTGKSPAESVNNVLDLPQWVASMMNEERAGELFDTELRRDRDELLDVLKLALHCVDPSPAARPEVRRVLEQLEEMEPDLAAAQATRTSSIEEGGVAATGISATSY